MAKKAEAIETVAAPTPRPSALGKYPVAYRRVAIDDVFEDPANARKHGEENLAAIAGSLRSFGQVESLVVQKSSGKVIGGNGRLKVMRSLGWKEIDIAELDIDNAGAAALGIVLNRSAELADWDTDALDKLLREIDTGDEDLQEMFSKLAEDEDIVNLDDEPELGDPDEVPEPPVDPVTKPGDVWLLGAYFECEKCGKAYEYEQGLAMKEGCPCG
jgi:ParB-like chromosome segregation protein Spo0J